MEVGDDVPLIVPNEARSGTGRHLQDVHAEGVPLADERVDVHHAWGGLFRGECRTSNRIIEGKEREIEADARNVGTCECVGLCIFVCVCVCVCCLYLCLCLCYVCEKKRERERERHTDKGRFMRPKVGREGGRKAKEDGGVQRESARGRPKHREYSSVFDKLSRVKLFHCHGDNCTAEFECRLSYFEVHT